MSALIESDTYDFTILGERAFEKPIQNSNIRLTLGGKAKRQADSERLSITCEWRIKQSELNEMNRILTNFSSILYYTPSRVLYDRETIKKMEVVIKGSPTVKNKAFNGEKYYYIGITLEEVLF